jgi:hypothetical protein
MGPGPIELERKMPMVTMDSEGSTRKGWRIGPQVLWFALALCLGAFVPLAPLLSALGLEPVEQTRSMFRFGGTALLINALLLGTLIFSLTALIGRRRWPEPPRRASALAGLLYTLVIFSAGAFVSIEPGSLSGRLFVAWLLLFPVLAVVVFCLGFRRR